MVGGWGEIREKERREEERKRERVRGERRKTDEIDETHFEMHKR